MKSTGMVRKLDPLGRIVIPIELRRVLQLNENDPLEVFTEGDRIIFQKYVPYKACVVTGEVSQKNKVYKGGIILSDEGAQLLLKELQSNTYMEGSS
ncbi:AbrB/MazE/SpoVT family DNA-binding domain-containing protein [Metabacillus fastidiosus]|uniref:AbrB/MazE/SpoVT family DNA-binding domain-containing protein n=1 Tax=Metabacillus fastidiosus TaxID=1458 RepID=UPI002E230AE1|nr:AbrB/MazE/SpoVT family DNA-binding domain-containing protein [Metabacillus fastidiosus]